MSLITSILTGGVNNHETTAEEANALATDFISEGIVGAIANTSGVAPATGGFAVNATGTPDTNIQISAGTAYVTATPSTQGSQTIRVKNSATITQAISANSSGSTKYDWVYLSVDATNANAPNTAGDNVASITVSRSSSAATDDGTPPTYAILLAVVTVANGFSTITNSVIRDSRTRCTVGATSESPETYWVTGGLPAVSSVTENGNRSADITFASTVASTLTPGMRLRTSRTVAAPTQCADLEASSSQAFQRTSASGFSTGTTWTIKAKIKPESYGVMVIAALDDGTNILQLYLDASGRLVIAGGTTSATDAVTSQQSVALGKWQDVTASITIGTPTGEIRIDNVVVPSSVTASAATTMTVSGAITWNIGRNNAGNYFDGKIAQVAIFNAIISDATLKTYSNQTMTGSETNCKGFWSLNNTLADLSASANTLTAGGGAVATNADSPFAVDANGTPGGTYDYAIVTKVSTTTATVQYPEGCAIPTSGGISAVDYSGVKAPFGMPVDGGRWEVVLAVVADVVQSAVTGGTQYNPGGLYIDIPLGQFELTGRVMTGMTGSTTVDKDIYVGLSTSASTFTDNRLRSYQFWSGHTTLRFSASFTPTSLNLSSATKYYVVFLGAGGGTLTNLGITSNHISIVRAVPAHL